MTPEERERTMEFILQQQAQFSVDLQREHEERVKDRPRLARLETVFVQLTELAQIQSQRIEQNEERIKLSEEQIKLSEERIKQNEEQIKQNRKRIEQNERTSSEMLSRLDRILDRLTDKT